MMSTEEKLQKFLDSHGYVIHGMTDDGEFHRFALDDHDKKKSGWYVLHCITPPWGDPFYLLNCNDFRSDDPVKTFCSLSRRAPQAHKDLKKAQIQKDIERSENEKQKNWEEACAEVSEEWAKLVDKGESPYLTKKQIAHCAHLNVRFDVDHHEVVVPLRDKEGKLWNLQRIKPDGFKLFHSGARCRGLFHVLGLIDDKTSKIYIAEGFSTAASIQLATNAPVIFALNAQGLKTIHEHLPAEWLKKKIILCGDDDVWKEKNTGRECAEAAGKSIFGSTVIFPNFKEPIPQLTDFNDLHVAEGIDAVGMQLDSIDDKAEAITDAGILSAPFPDQQKTKFGFKRLGTFANFTELCRRTGIVLRYNIVKKAEEILVPNKRYSIDNRMNASVATIVDWAVKSNIPTSNLRGILTSLCDENPYNPVAEWIESTPWDGESRLEDFYETIISSDEDFKKVLIRRWLISAIAAMYEPDGATTSGVLVFQGVQYVGKTQWFRRLVPESLKHVRIDGVTLQADNKDSVYLVLSNWLVELGELDSTFRKSDINHLKAFLAKNFDTLRRPYAQCESQFARRTVFFGSVNEVEYLNDPTGNRRFWTIECQRIHWDHSVDMQQLWAECLVLYKSGEQWHLTTEENDRLSKHNEQYQVSNPLESLLWKHFAWEEAERANKMTAHDVGKHIGFERLTLNEVRNLGRAIVRLTKAKPGGRGSIYHMMPRSFTEVELSAQQGTHRMVNPVTRPIALRYRQPH